MLSDLIEGFKSIFMVIPVSDSPKIEPITKNRTDAEALSKDWQNISNDMTRTLEGVENE